VFIASERGRLDYARFLATYPNEQMFIAAITASELLHGCARAVDSNIRQRRIRFVENVLGNYKTIAFGLAEARLHAAMWAKLESEGKMIGERDLQIAATAIANGHRLTTLNRGEFERVSGLLLEKIDIS
jgi:tRNA(fMet)-specific endonuclease VapC